MKEMLQKLLAVTIVLFTTCFSKAETLNFDQPFGTESWSEDGYSWSWDNSGWDNIRTYSPRTGSGHAMTAAGYASKLSMANYTLNIQGIYLKVDMASDFIYLTIRGYNTSGTEIYTANLNPYNYEMDYAYVTLNWTNVKSIKVDYDESGFGSSTVFYDDMEYTANVLLPVTLLSFSGKQKEKDNLLNWQTVSERNNAYFNVQYSKDGHEFQTITQVNSAAKSGASTAFLNYSTVHNTPSPGNNFYRLQQVDHDGTVSYSSIINLFRSEESEEVSISPTIASTNLKIMVNNRLQEYIPFVIVNINGSSNLSGTLNRGTNTVNIAHLVPGLYVLQLKDRSHTVVRFLKR